jgi:hypothetical protein
MKFINSVASIFLASASVQALPKSGAESSVAERQEGARLYIRYYSDTSCSEPWREDDVWLQEIPAGCIDVNFTTFEYNSFAVIDNFATRTGMALPPISPLVEHIFLPSV